MTKQITTYKKPKEEMFEIAESVTIKTAEDMVSATSVLSTLNTYLDSVVAYKEKKTKPLNEALKIIRAETKPLEDRLNASIKSVREQMGAYQLIASKVAEDKARLVADKISTGEISMEKGIQKLEKIATPDAHIESDQGSVKFRKDRVLRVLDLTKIPPTYFDLNESRLTKALKEGANVPGATLEDKLITVNKR